MRGSNLTILAIKSSYFTKWSIELFRMVNFGGNLFTNNFIDNIYFTRVMLTNTLRALDKDSKL